MDAWGVDGRRAVRATSIVVLLVLFVALSGAIESEGTATAGEVGPDGIDARETMRALALGDDLAIDHAMDGRDALPAAFAAEVGLPDGCRNVTVSSSGSVVGFIVDGAAADVSDELRGRMEEAGWSCVPLGALEGATFVKESGACRWVMATCTQVGAATSVVMRCVIS